MSALRVLFFLVLANLATAQTVTQQDHIIARQRLRVGTDTSKYFTSIIETLTGSSTAITHRQAPTAKAVRDYIHGINVTGSGGISVSGNGYVFPLVITNTAPDQVVSIIGATGTYPNFTLPDASATNEIQSLSIAGNNLSISGGNTVVLPGTTYTGGTGISVSGTVITNTAPDQTVSIIGATGTYPNFTLPDASATNEIQSLSIAGNNLSISGGNTVVLPGTTYTGGTGISVSGTVITNTGDTNAADDITGSGTSFYVPRFTGTNTLGNSILYQNADSIVIGATSGRGRLNVRGSGATSATYTAQFHNSTGSNNALLVRNDGIVSSGTTYAGGRLNIGYLGGTVTEKVIDIYESSWGEYWIGRYADLSTRGLTFGGTGSGGTAQNDVFTIRTFPLPKASLHRPSSSLGYLLDIGGITNFDGLVLTRAVPADSSQMMIHINQDGDGLLRVKSGRWTFGDWDVGAADQNPEATLHLFAAAGNNSVPLLRLEKTGSWGYSQFEQFATPSVRGLHIGGPNFAGTYARILTISNTGRSLGINTETPAQTLDVVGAARISASAGIATAIMGRNASGDISNLSLGSGLSLSSGTLSATNSGTVTSASVVTANGFAGSVATATTTPAITLSTTVTGLLKGNGTSISSAVAGTDYVTGNLYTTNGTLTGDRTITVGNNLVTVDASTSSFLTTTPWVWKAKATGSNASQIQTFQNESGNPIAYMYMNSSAFGLYSMSTYDLNMGAGDFAWKFDQDGFFKLHNNAIDPSNLENGALWYNTSTTRFRARAGGGTKTIATREDDINTTLATLSVDATHQAGSGLTEMSASGGNRTLTIGNNMIEGRIYTIRATNNSSNTVTLSRDGSNVFYIDGSNASATTYVMGVEEMVRVIRYGTLIYLDK